jgi:parallel beta-helix repeat protein
MWLGDPDKNDDGEGGDGEYKDNWDFSFYTKDEISLGNSPQLSIATWYEYEDVYDGGHVQVSTDSGDSWDVLTPTGDYPCSNVQALGDEGYCDDSAGWLIENFSLSDYDNDDILLRFRFASDPSVYVFEGWYIDDVVVTDGQQTLFSDDFESGNAKWIIDRFITPLEGADALVTDREGVQYASSYFGGSSPKSDDSGWLNHQEEIPVIAQRYYSSSNAIVQDVELRLRYVDWHQTSILNVSEENTRLFKVPDFRVYHSGDLYYNIQSAIENATSGDTVYAWNGTFRENLIIDRGVTLLGNGTGSTIIDGAGNTSVKVTGKYATIANLTVKGATTSANYGIYVNSSGGGLNATGVRLHDNYIGLYFNSKSWGSRIADSTINSNSNSGFHIFAATGIRIENCTISNNGLHGIHISSAPDALVYGNHIHNNTSDGMYIPASGSGVGVHHNRVVDNGDDGINTPWIQESSFTYNEIRDNDGVGIYTGARNSQVGYRGVLASDLNRCITCTINYGTSGPVT